MEKMGAASLSQLIRMLLEEGWLNDARGVNDQRSEAARRTGEE
jgi:hypothetical protein